MDLSDEFCDKCKDKAKILQILAFEEGIEEADHNRLKPALGEKLGGTFNLILIQRSFHHAGWRH